MLSFNLTDSTNNIEYYRSKQQLNSIYTTGLLDTINAFTHQLIISKFKTNLSTNWNNIIIDSIGNSSQIILSTKYIYLHSSKNWNPTFVKLDTNGQTQFIREINAPFMYGKQGKGMIYLRRDSTFIMAGDGNFSVSAKDRWIIRIKENGDTLFAKAISNYGAGWVTGIVEDYNPNNFYLTGNSIAKYTIDGTLISDTYYPNEFQTVYSMSKTKDNNFILGGALFNDFALTKIDTFGNVIWSRTFNPFPNTSATNYKTIQTLDGGYLMCGVVTYIDILLIKVDSLGFLNFATSINPITKKETDLLIYPNPTNNIININTDLLKDIKTIKVYNLVGELLFQQNKNFNMVDLGNYSNGTYLISIETNQNTITRKIIKQ
jgi:Secretion system C-terminal sorting domain